MQNIFSGTCDLNYTTLENDDAHTRICALRFRTQLASLLLERFLMRPFAKSTTQLSSPIRHFTSGVNLSAFIPLPLAHSIREKRELQVPLFPSGYSE